MDRKDLILGGFGLAFDAVEGVTDIVEGMHRNIAASPLDEAPRGRAPGIAGLVYACVRGVNSVVRGGVRHALAQTALPEGQRETSREPWLAALNGVLGDHLDQSANPLAIAMRWRVDGHELPTDEAGLRAAIRDPRSRVLLLVHGLCMNDLQWTRTREDGSRHDHGLALASALAATPLWLHYNSGRHISTNGRELARQLQQLAEAWPVPLRTITLLGHSMGGLVIRSALRVAEDDGAAWLAKVDRAFYLGSPHHGAALERAGNRLQAMVAWSRYSAPLAGLGAIRSAGITDLRHGNVVDADWDSVERFAHHEDRRRTTPLAVGPEHFAIAGTLSPAPTGLIADLLGDGMVHPSSATGRHRDPARTLAFGERHVRIVPATGHLELLSSADVYAQLEQWLGA